MQLFLLPLKKESSFYSQVEHVDQALLILAEMKTPGLGSVCEDDIAVLIMALSSQDLDSYSKEI